MVARLRQRKTILDNTYFIENMTRKEMFCRFASAYLGLIILCGLSSCNHLSNRKLPPPMSSHNLPSPIESANNQGFTCTGMTFYDKDSVWYVGDIGTLSPENDLSSVIRVIDKNFQRIIRTIPLYTTFPDMQAIQGIAIDSIDTSIWLCSYEENLIRHIDQGGNSLSYFSMKHPTGITYDKDDDTLWVLTSDTLYKTDKLGNRIDSISFCERAQDQICKYGNKLYITSGDDYQKEQFVWTIDLNKNKYAKKYIASGCYAIEGIAIVDSVIYIANDGIYHNARIRANIVNCYPLNSLSKL